MVYSRTKVGEIFLSRRSPSGAEFLPEFHAFLERLPRVGFRWGQYPPEDFLDVFRGGFRLQIELFRRFPSPRFEGLRPLADIVEGGEKYIHLAQGIPDFAGDARRNMVRRGRISAFGEV